MKLSRNLLAGMCVCMLSTGNLTAQCTGGITPTLITHDTTVIGTGTAPYSFTFPRFDAEQGTLTEVRVQSVVSLQYTFTLENPDPFARNIRHWLRRYDEIYSSILPFPIFNTYESTQFGPYLLAPSSGLDGTGTDFVGVPPINVLHDDTVVNETFYNVADFMGLGDISFDYMTTPGTVFSGGLPITTASITDVIKFNISYVYCSAAVLASNSMTLTAENAGQRSAMIKWNTSNESRAKSYEVMVSEDGKNFKTAIIMDASGNFANDLGAYQFKYDFSSPAKHLYFRVKQITKDNKVSVTAIKPVSWVTPFKGTHFLPDPSGSFITVSLPAAGGSPWSIALFGSNGQLLQNDQVKNTNTTLSIKHKLQKGIYIIRATNNGTREVITQKISIQ